MTLTNTRFLKARFLHALALLAAGGLLAGCGGGEDAPQQSSTPQSGYKIVAEESPLKVLEMPRTPSPEGAVVFLSNINDGDTVTSPLALQFGAENIAIVTAGTYDPATGHHHLLIDAPLPPMNQAFPADTHHIHFGGGQLETIVELEPGTHTLQLILGDGNHVPHEPPVISERITITVE